MPRKVVDGFRFGTFALDVHERELFRDDERLRLSDQPFDVLRVLLQHAGSLVTREDLRRELWRDGTFVDFEHGLNAAVKRLRAAIGDNADDPTFIETLPRRGYRFIANVEPLGAEASRPRAASLPRLAVLPFAAVGEDKTTTFSEGLSEELTTTLGRVFGTRVGILASSSVARAARVHPRSMREIGRALSADFILNGAVRQDGDRVRVTARLIDARVETQLWSGAYERNLADWFAVQRDVASEIARSLEVELIPRQASTCCAPITRDTAAHHAYLKGRYYWNLPGPAGLQAAIDFYEEAIAADPNFRAALSSLARCWVSMADYYLVPPKWALENARDAARRAIAIDAADAEAHIALGDVYRSLEWNWPAAEREYRLASASNPSHEAAYRLSGLLLAAGGHYEEARELVQRAWELDPLCLVVNTTAAWAHYLSGDHDAAIERCLHVIDMNDEFMPAHCVRSAALVQLGRVPDAVAVLDAIPEERHDSLSTAWLSYALAKDGKTSRARALVTGLEVAQAASTCVSSYHLALAHTGLGDDDSAFTCLERAREERDPGLTFIATEPRLAPLRSDSRFRALTSSMGFAVG